MGENHKVRFEPVGIDIEVDEDETVLNAAFRQGVMLMHGCKEGQCSACKSFLLDGDVQMDRYSTFALADYESEEGYVLLCRSQEGSRPSRRASRPQRRRSRRKRIRLRPITESHAPPRASRISLRESLGRTRFRSNYKH